MLTIPPKLKQKRECKQRQKDIINGLLNNYDKETKVDDNVSFDDCIQVPADIKIRGKEIKQATETGNLIDNEWEQGDIDSNTGMNVKSDVAIRLKNFQKVFPGNLYKISRSISTNYMRFRFYDKDYNFLGTQSPENGLVESNINNNQMNIKQSSMEMTILNTEVAYMKIVDLSNDSNIIYTMTTEAINIDYPSSIEYVKGNQEVEHTNKNLLKQTNLSTSAINVGIAINSENYVYDTSPETDGRSISYENCTWKIHLKAGTYNFSGFFKQQITSLNTGLLIYDDNNNILLNKGYNAIVNKDSVNFSFTIDEDKNIGIFIKIYDGVANFQLEENIATEYTAHQSETYQLSNLPQMYSPEDKIIYLKSDDENANDGAGWYVSRNFKIVNNFTNITRETTKNSSKKRLALIIDKNFKQTDADVNKNGGLCNFLNLINNAKTFDCIEGFTVSLMSPTSDIVRIYMYIEKFSNPDIPLSTVIAKLQEINAYFILPIKNPEYEKITDPALIEQLEKLQKIFTYEGTNHFIATNEQGQAMSLEVTVYKNSIKIMQKEIDNLKELVLNNVANS